MQKRINITGNTYHRLKVISYYETIKGQPHWLCKCTCGKMLIVRGCSLKDGNTKSCGCQKIDSATKHGHNAVATNGSASPTYITWQAMIQRCTNPSSDQYYTYGAIGITICKEWFIFENFLADVGERPSGKTLDRFPNKSGNYEPGNVRWATSSQQARNRKDNRMITFNGKTECVAEWADIQGIPRTVIQDRLRLNWNEIDAITIPYKPRTKR